MTAADEVRMTVRVTGIVQGVGFRWFVRQTATTLGLAGSAVNAADGSVEIVAEGARGVCERLADALRAGERRPGRVDQVTVQWSEPTGLTGFDVG